MALGALAPLALGILDLGSSKVFQNLGFVCSGYWGYHPLPAPDRAKPNVSNIKGLILPGAAKSSLAPCSEPHGWHLLPPWTGTQNSPAEWSERHRPLWNHTGISWIRNQFNLFPCIGTRQGRCQALTTGLQVQGRKNPRTEPMQATPSNASRFLRLGLKEVETNRQARLQLKQCPPSSSVSAGPLRTPPPSA